MRSKVFFSTAVAFLLFQTACNNDPKPPDIDESQLVGRWEIESGYRNGKKIETLVGTYFEFSQEGKLKTNLTPSATEEQYDYSVDGNIINQEGELPVNYTIDSLTEVQLNVSMVINNFPFQVFLKKAQPMQEAEQEGIMQ